jgi:hypothetical protein
LKYHVLQALYALMGILEIVLQPTSDEKKPVDIAESMISEL